MPRPTLNPLSQTELVSELKRWIDTARFNPPASTSEVNAINAVIRLIGENPTSSLRPHVLHNIGCRRRKWLRQLSTTLPPSLAAEKDIAWQMGCDSRAVGKVADYAVG